MSILIALFWVVLFLALLDSDLLAREAVLASLLGSAALLLLLTEALSPFALLTSEWLAFAWALATTVLIAAFRRRVLGGLRRIHLISRWRPGRGEAAVTALFGFFGAGTLVSTVAYPPANYDSLTYHLPRVFFWLQNQSVDHFATVEPRMLFSSPFANYVVLHLQALSGGSDQLAGVSQWVAYLCSAVSVSLLARGLGAGPAAQTAAALTTITVPMAVLQASTTQNDLMCALWCLIAAYGFVRLSGSVDERSPSLVRWALWSGVAAGLALQTKPTALLALAPFVIWVVVALLRRASPAAAIRLVGVGLACVLALNLVWYARNGVALDGDFLALNAPGNTHILTQARTPGALAANLLKNTFALAGTPFPRINESMSVIVAGGVGFLDSAQLPDMPAEAGYGPFAISSEFRSHDLAPAGLFMLLGAAAIASIAAHRKNVTRGVWYYTACAGAALGITLIAIAWQPWVARLSLPALLMIAPLIGVAFEQVARTANGFGRLLLSGLLALSVLLAAASMVLNATYPLAPLQTSVWNSTYEERRFRVSGDLETAFRDVERAAAEAGVERIGIDQDAIDFRLYPLLALMPESTFGYIGDVVAVEGIDPAAFEPEAVVEITAIRGPESDSFSETDPGGQLMAPRRAGDRRVRFYRVP
ncbi:MAG: glycosyltransferase family 39 protein [Coriobacteriia bacterium]|nr:glycosyltransferase family 39 protein [Coriobacteriia bacterium]